MPHANYPNLLQLAAIQQLAPPKTAKLVPPWLPGPLAMVANASVVEIGVALVAVLPSEAGMMAALEAEQALRLPPVEITGDAA